MPKFHSEFNWDDVNKAAAKASTPSGGPNAALDYTQGGKDIYTQAAEQLLNQSRNKDNFDDFKDQYAYDIATQLVRHNENNKNLGEDESKNLIDTEYDKIINRAKDYIPNANWDNTRSGKELRQAFGSVSEDINPLNALNKFNNWVGSGIEKPVDALIAGGAGIANMLQGRDAWDESDDVRKWREGFQDWTTPETMSVVPSVLEDVGIGALGAVLSPFTAGGTAAASAGLIAAKNALENSPQIIEGLSDKDTITGVSKNAGERALQTGVGVLPVALSALPMVGKLGKLAGSTGKAVESDVAKNVLKDAIDKKMAQEAEGTSLKKAVSETGETEGKAFSKEDFKDIGQDIKDRVINLKENNPVTNIKKFLDKTGKGKEGWLDEAMNEAGKAKPEFKNIPETGDVKQLDEYFKGVAEGEGDTTLFDVWNSLSPEDKAAKLQAAFEKNPDLENVLKDFTKAPESNINAALEEELFPNKKKRTLSNLAQRFSPAEKKNAANPSNLENAINSLDKFANGEQITGQDIKSVDNLLKTVQAQDGTSNDVIQNYAQQIANGDTDAINLIKDTINKRFGTNGEEAKKSIFDRLTGGPTANAAETYNDIVRGGELYQGLPISLKHPVKSIGKGLFGAAKTVAPLGIATVMNGENAAEVPPGLFPAMALSLALRKPSSRILSSAAANPASKFTNFGKLSASKGSLYNTYNLASMINAINQESKWKSADKDKGPDAAKNLNNWMKEAGDYYSKAYSSERNR